MALWSEQVRASLFLALTSSENISYELILHGLFRTAIVSTTVAGILRSSLSKPVSRPDQFIAIEPLSYAENPMSKLKHEHMGTC